MCEAQCHGGRGSRSGGRPDVAEARAAGGAAGVATGAAAGVFVVGAADAAPRCAVAVGDCLTTLSPWCGEGFREITVQFHSVKLRLSLSPRRVGLVA